MAYNELINTFVDIIAKGNGHEEIKGRRVFIFRNKGNEICIECL